MCVLETTWETKRNRTKKNKCIINDKMKNTLEIY